jgi:hypothetical protein
VACIDGAGFLMLGVTDLLGGSVSLMRRHRPAAPSIS